MDKYFMWIHYERLHNHNKAKHNKTVCIFLGIYCSVRWLKTIYSCAIVIWPYATTIWQEKKHQSSASLAFVRGIHRWPVWNPPQRDSAAENISIWLHYHEQEGCCNIGSHLKTYHYHPEYNLLITFFVYQKGYQLYPNLAVILSCSMEISKRIGNWNQLSEQTIFVGNEFTKAASITNFLFSNTPRLMLYHCITYLDTTE